MAPLTTREPRCHPNRGWPQQQGIAIQLGVGVRTVETHRERIMRSRHSPRAGLTKYAIARGWVSVGRK